MRHVIRLREDPQVAVYARGAATMSEEADAAIVAVKETVGVFSPGQLRKQRIPQLVVFEHEAEAHQILGG